MKNLKTARKNANMTQKDVAIQLKIPATTYANYEQNEKSLPPVNILIEIANLFGCSVDYLIGHQTQSILYLDNFTDSQRTLISIIKNLNEDQTNNLIGRASEMLNLPYSSIKPVRPW